MHTIGFVGLGHMGNPMVQNLLKNNMQVQVYDVSSEAMHALTKLGAIAAPSLQALAESAEIIITSLQTGAQVSEVCLSPDGIFSHAPPDLLYIDCSSIDILTTHALHVEADKLQIAMLDAPVSGGVLAAKDHTLTIMVGGLAEYFARAKPILELLGKKIVHAGPATHGQAAKICNNLLLGISMIGVSEAFSLAKKLGLDLHQFYDISSHASGQCWAMTNYCPVPGMIENVPANHGYQPGFMAKMMLKDLRLAQHAAEACNATIPLGAVAAELYELYVNQGRGDLDFSGIIQLLNDDGK